MLGPGCWSIRVACSPGANCLEDLIHWLLPPSPSMMPAKKPHVNFAPLSYGRGALQVPNFCPDDPPEPYHKTHWLNLFYPFQKRGTWVAWKPKDLRTIPSQLSSDPSKLSRAFRIQHGQSIYSFHNEKQTLGHVLFEEKSRFCIFAEGRCRVGCPTTANTQPSSPAFQGARADPGMTAVTRMSRGLGGAQAVIAGRIACLFEWLLASVEFANLAMPSGWAEPGACQASWRLPGRQKCFKGYALQSKGIRPWRASWSGVPGLLILPLSGSGSLIIPTFPKVRWAHPKGWLLEEKQALLPHTHPPPPLPPPRRLRVHPVVCLPPGPQLSAVFSN